MTCWAQKTVFGKSYAVVIGINAYESYHWPDLPYPEKDAGGIADYLSLKGYKVKTFYGKNAKRQRIIDYLVDLAFRIEGRDRFIFFFSGHGETREAGKKEYGYIIPVDATEKPATWIGMVQLEDIADMMNAARHQLFLFDSCFGGMFGLKSSMSGFNPGTPDYINKISSRKARQYSTAGGKDEQVLADGPDGYSYFTGYLLKALHGDANTNSDGYITASELRAYLVPAASNRYHTPSGGTFSGHEQGDFLFEVKTSGTVKKRTEPVSSKSLLKGGPKIDPVEAQYKAKKNAWVREEPNIKSNRVTMLNKGQTVWVAGSTFSSGNVWYFVNLPDNKTGYIYGTLLVEVEDPSNQPTASVVKRTNVQSTTSLSVRDVINPPVYPYVKSGKKYKWRMATTWPRSLPLFQEVCEKFASLVKEKSKGRLIIEVFGAGELVPAFEVFDAASKGVVECGSGAAYYWAGKVPAAQWFATVPFGMNPGGMAKWIHKAGGQQLWEEVYRPFNLIPRPAGNMGAQMGGWFKKEINSMEDLKGLKMRLTGLGGKVLSKAGGVPVVLPGGEVYIALERGVIDATEWSGPYLDRNMGFFKVSKYYYYPGWHEPGTMLEFFFNLKAYLTLPYELQTVIDKCALECERWLEEETEGKNREALKDLIENKKVVIKKFPDDVIEGLKKISEDVLYDESRKDEMTQKVYNAYRVTQKKFGESASFTANTYYDIVR
jgi:TRAP-type mannitol/chloroaromatic compound transport system substrate-binding protein